MGDNIKNQFNQSTLHNPVFNYGEKKISKHLTLLPLAPEVFLGREDDLEQVHKKLFSNTGKNVLLLVNGRGGIGKTTFASKYYYRYHEEYTHLAWVFAEKGLLEALLVLAGPQALDLTFEDKLPNEQRLGQLLQVMGELDKPCLLVVDNANELDELEKYHLAMKSCPNFHILLTTRVTQLGQTDTHPLGTLDRDMAKELFTTYYKAHLPEEDALLEQVLEAVSYNTLVIELLAKNLSNFNNLLKKRYPLSDFLNDLSEKGLFGVQGKNVQTLYQANELKMREEKPETILEAMYDFIELANSPRELLSVFSVLPAEAIPFVQLEILLADRENLDEPLLDLWKKGWLDYEEESGTFRISPVVQEITRKKNGIGLWEEILPVIEELQELLDGDRIHENNYLYSTVYSRYAENIIALAIKAPILNLEEGEILDSVAVLCSRVGVFFQVTGNLQKASHYFDYFRKMEKELHDVYPEIIEFKNNLAISYQYLGEIHNTEGNLEKALSFYEKYNMLEKELYEAYPFNVEFKDGLAISYQFLGKTQGVKGNWEKALGFYKMFNKLEKELHDADPDNVEFKNNLAISYQYLGEAHNTDGNLKKALNFFKEFNKLEKELHEAYPDNVEFKDNLAISYQHLGEFFYTEGNWEKALDFYKKFNKLEKELHEAYPENVEFKDGLAISHQYLGEIYNTLGNLAKALGFYKKFNKLEKELHEAYPENVEFKNNLAFSNLKLGSYYEETDKTKSKKYFLQCQNLWQDLVDQFPDYIEFKDNLDMVKETLEAFKTNS